MPAACSWLRLLCSKGSRNLPAFCKAIHCWSMTLSWAALHLHCLLQAINSASLMLNALSSIGTTCFLDGPMPTSCDAFATQSLLQTSYVRAGQP